MASDAFTVDTEELRAAAERFRHLGDGVPGAGALLLRAEDYGDATLTDAAREFASRWGRALTVLASDLEGVGSNVSTCATAYDSTDSKSKDKFDACAPVAMG